MRHRILAAALALGLAGCVGTGVRDEAPATAAGVAPNAIASGGIRTQTYTPSATRDGMPGTEQRARADREVAPQGPPPPAGSPARRGSSTPPPNLADPGQPPLAPLPGPAGSEEATARFKRDLMAPQVDRMRTDDALGRLDPNQQRDLLNRQLELHRLETDPLRR